MKKSKFKDSQIIGYFRDECLSMEWFRNRVDAKITIESWEAALQRG